MGADIKGQTMAALPGTLDAMNEQSSKACTKCGAVKLLSEFARCKDCRDGISPICRKCRYQQSNDIRKNNREKYLLSERKYREMNIDKVRAQSAAWYLKNKEREAAKKKEWAKNNKEKRREQDRAAAERMNSRYTAKALRMRAAEITPELIALKREQLTIHRLARQLKEKANESSTDPR